MQRITSRLTYANVMATTAVFIALGGSSYAAVKIAKDAVGATQIKAGAVRSSEVKDGALGAADLSSAARAALKGNKGDKGDPGAKGDTGTAGTPGAKGDKGDPGTARGYAVVLADGSFAPTVASSSSLGLDRAGFDNITVTHPATGVYCFATATTADIPTSVMVAGNNSIDSGFSGGDDHIATATIRRGGGLAGCAGTDRMRVRIYDASAAALADGAFWIWLL